MLPFLLSVVDDELLISFADLIYNYKNLLRTPQFFVG